MTSKNEAAPKRSYSALSTARTAIGSKPIEPRVAVTLYWPTLPLGTAPAAPMSSAHPIKANWQNQLAQRGSTVTLTPPAAQPLKFVALLCTNRGVVPRSHAAVVVPLSQTRGVVPLTIDSYIFAVVVPLSRTAVVVPLTHPRGGRSAHSLPLITGTLLLRLNLLRPRDIRARAHLSGRQQAQRHAATGQLPCSSR